eukprot:5408789-Pyramimonas_sp.AAC.1
MRTHPRPTPQPHLMLSRVPVYHTAHVPFGQTKGRLPTGPGVNLACARTMQCQRAPLNNMKRET